MKNIKTLFAIGLTALLVSCGTSKETTSSTVNQDRGRSNIETTSNSSSKTIGGSRTARKEAVAVATENRLAEVEEQMYFKRMYSDLDMTDVQISHFEKEWKTANDTWKRNNRYKVMNSYERIEYQDKILRDILDDSQFESYQQWVRENADRK